MGLIGGPSPWVLAGLVFGGCRGLMSCLSCAISCASFRELRVLRGLAPLARALKVRALFTLEDEEAIDPRRFEEGRLNTESEFVPLSPIAGQVFQV